MLSRYQTAVQAVGNYIVIFMVLKYKCNIMELEDIVADTNLLDNRRILKVCSQLVRVRVGPQKINRLCYDNF